jgi:hypothetical protein
MPADGATVDAARRRVSLALPLAGLVGCSTPLVTPIPRAQALRLEFSRSGADEATAVKNLSLGADARTGAGTGAVAGALSGLSCGPWAFLCVPAGLLVGSLAGWGGGAVVGMTGALSEEKVQSLRERLTRAMQAHDLWAELRENITRRADKVWDLSAPTPSLILNVQLQGLALTSTRSDFIGLVVRVQTVLERETAGQRERLGEKLFVIAPEASPLAVWLDERGDFVDTLLSSCSQQLAAQIVAEYGRE